MCVIVVDHLSSLKECCYDGCRAEVEQKKSSFNCDFKKVVMLKLFGTLVIRLKNKLRERTSIE